MLFVFLFLAIWSTVSYINILVVDICNSRTYVMAQNEEIMKIARKMSIYRWVLIFLMSLFWALFIIW